MDGALAMCHERPGIPSPASDPESSGDGHDDSGSDHAGSTPSPPQGKAKGTAESAPMSGKRKRKSEDQIVPPAATPKRQRTTGPDLYKTGLGPEWERKLALLLPYPYIVKEGLGDRFPTSQALFDAEKDLFGRVWIRWIDHCEKTKDDADKKGLARAWPAS